MKRNFPDFLTAYYKYSKDGFCPNVFHYWTGVSVVSGALERKVWLPQSSKFNTYPNLYILLVSLPGMGKSSAANIGIDLLKDCGTVQFLPTQVTEAKLIELLSGRSIFTLGNKEHQHSSRFYYASEASNSLRNIYGDFIACLTDFYDCPKLWEKATIKADKVALSNVCLNMLAGCTFDYLSKLVTDDNIMGGFASRLIYIIHDEKCIRSPSWESEDEHDPDMREALLADLKVIHSLKGKFRADKGFKQKWESWFPKFDELRQEHESEKMQSLLVRKSMNLLKLCMIMSASKSNDLVITEEHWQEAMMNLDRQENNLPKMLRIAQMKNTDSQKSLNLAILAALDDCPGKRLTEKLLKGKLLNHGFEPTKIKGTLELMAVSETQIKKVQEDGKEWFQLLVDPNNNL